ncbi:MAG: S8 family serine peptidase [Candidatus Binatia bacterium]
MGCRRSLLAVVMLLVSGMPAQAQEPSAGAATAGLVVERARLGTGDPKLDSHLRDLLAPRTIPPSAKLVPTTSDWVRGGRVHVVVRVASTAPQALAELAGAGLAVEHVAAAHRLVGGWVSPSSLTTLSAVPNVGAIRPALPGRVRTVEGDAASRANVARSTSGFTGAGVKVGVISDGNDDGFGSSSTPIGCSAGSGVEGSAMLEIVNALAPGATLYFSEGISGTLGFIASVDCLRSAGAKVIVDDIGFFDEPFFEDGPVATAVKSAIAAGVSYHTAAGNEGDIHYSAAFSAAPASTLHAFDGAADTSNDVVVGSGRMVQCVLQWNDRWGQSGNNYDLALYDTGGTLIDSSTTVQAGASGDDPFEFVAATNLSGSAQTVRVVIDRVSGSSKVLKLFCLGADSMQYVTPAQSIIGHPAVAEAVTVAAIDVGDPGLNDVEVFSSQGPVPIYFPASETRSKPDLAGFDGVTTGASQPGFSPFYGTSAAAPHSAAVAALVLSKNDCLTPAMVQSTLKGAAVDIGATGFDSVAGAGRLDAKNAIDLVGTKNCVVDADCNDADACTTDTCTGCVCAHTAVSCSDGNACTADTCNSATGCQHANEPDGTACPDTTVCNGAETCQSGTCTAGTPLTCTDGLVCTLDTCDPVAGCQYPPDPCSDGNACTADSCTELTGCQHDNVADGTSCADSDPCNGAETCMSGTCTAGTPLVCDDDDQCSENTCVQFSGCSYPPIEGFPGLDCLCGSGLPLASCGETDVVPAAVGSRFQRACDLVARAEAQTSTRKRRKLLKRAAALYGKAARKAERAYSRARLSDACGSALATRCWDANGRATRLRDGL